MVKNFMSSRLMFLVQYSVFVTTILLLSHHGFAQSDANLVEKICRRTPNYNLCVTSLKSDPKSSTADVTGLALIMVGVLKQKASLTMAFINEELKKGSPGLKQPLTSCSSKYDTILTSDIPEAIEALQKGDPKFAENGANDAAVEADSCEEDFKGKSPMSDRNKLIHDISIVAAAIIRNLL